MAAQLSDWGIQWTVLGVLRLFYTIRERQVTSKVRAGKYALTCVPARWHPLIQEAIAIREGSPQSHYRSRIKRAIESIRFLRYIIQVSNNDGFHIEKKD